VKAREHLEQLDLRSVIEPFLGVPELTVAVERIDGQVLAGEPSDGATDTAMAPISAHGEVVGRVVLGGPAAASALGRATAAALAGALSAAAVGSPAPDDPQVVRRARQLDEELAHGRRLQRSFVSLEPPDVPGYDIASHYEAAREVGGDFFDLFRERRRGHPLSAVIADVTGKGVAAALLMAFTRPLLHAAIDHAPSPAVGLERTNHILVQERRTGLFVTALAARLELGSGNLHIANAGHEPPLFVPADGSPLGLILGSGPLLGAFGRLDLPDVTTTVTPGDVLVLYTDGVTDARSPGGDRWDEARFFEAVERARGGTAADVVTEIADAVAAFSRGTEQADDITVLAIGRRVPRTPVRRRARAGSSAP
jgi:serine phosphatase RsbU (regulator of sigma subunit)